MKAFVTGGTGFIGSHLVDRLLKSQNDEIHCLVRTDEKWLHDRDYVKVQGSLQDIPALQKGMEGADVVFHIAGVVMAPQQQIFNKANVEATETVLRLAMKHKVSKLIIFSSLAACGPSSRHPLTEQDPLMPVTMYGASKKRMEEMVRRVTDDTISVTIIRPPAVYGQREDQIFSVFKMAAYRLFPIIGDGISTKVSLIHVKDLVSGTLLAAQERKPGVETYFISSEDLYTWEEIRVATEAAFGHKLHTIRVSPRLVEHVGTVSEKAASFIGRYPVINRDKAKELGMQWTCSVEKAKKQLQYRQKTSLVEGLTETISWYKRHHWL